MDKYFLQEGGARAFLASSCQPDGPLGLNADLTLPYSRMKLRCKVEVLYNL